MSAAAEEEMLPGQMGGGDYSTRVGARLAAFDGHSARCVVKK